MRRLRDEEGMVTAFVTIFVVALIFVIGLVLDGGYLLAAQRLDLPPEAMLVLEDSGNGCAAAVASGAFAVAVPNRHTREHSFHGAKLIADTLADPRILAALQLPR